MNNNPARRTCLREPIPEIFDAARYLDAAVSAHLSGHKSIAEELIRLADIPYITDWTESLWGKGGPWSQPMAVENRLPSIPSEARAIPRMPTKKQLLFLIERDGFHCRFCGIPLVRSETRALIRSAYPEALRWGNRNADQHAGFQVMWLTYDHLLPHSRGGTSQPDNMLITCLPCNGGRSELTLDEVGLLDPRLREPIRSTWDGLERFRLEAIQSE